MFNFKKIASELGLKNIDLNTTINNFIDDKISKIDVSSMLNYISTQLDMDKQDSAKLLGDFWFETETLKLTGILLHIYCNELCKFPEDKINPGHVAYSLIDEENNYQIKNWVIGKLKNYNSYIDWINFTTYLVDYFTHLGLDKEFVKSSEKVRLHERIFDSYASLTRHVFYFFAENNLNELVGDLSMDYESNSIEDMKKNINNFVVWARKFKNKTNYPFTRIQEFKDSYVKIYSEITKLEKAQ